MHSPGLMHSLNKAGCHGNEAGWHGNEAGWHGNEAGVVLLATAQALMGQWVLVMVARHLADPQSHTRALPSLDTAGG